MTEQQVTTAGDPAPAADGAADGSRVAVVLAGAGARGAYEAGALSVILPALGTKPNYYIGSSAGGINAVGFASFSHLDPAEASAKVLDLWRSIGQSDVFRPPLAGLFAAALDRVVPGRAQRPRALLDTTPLHATLGKILNWDQLHANLEQRHVDACGVVVTARSTHSSEVLFESGSATKIPEDQEIRGIRFRPSRLTPAHVVASCSIPALFPAVAINGTGGGGDWYVDGGIRLNTPIKPALMLKARRIVVVTTNPISVVAGPGDPLLHPPGLSGGLVDVLRGVTVDPMIQDLRSLVHGNMRAERLRADVHVSADLDAADIDDADVDDAYSDDLPATIKYVFAGPRGTDPLADLARQVLRSGLSYPPPRPIAWLLARSHDLSELASHILFRPDFIAGAIEAGQEDARRQLHNGSVVWQTTELPKGS